MKRLWLTWETQRRNPELAQAFSCRYEALDYSRHSAVFRYLRSISDTFLVLLSVRPRVVFAQCPSLVLALFLAVLKPLFRFRFVIDAHNAAVEYTNSPRKLVSGAMEFALSQADIIILSNAALVEQLPRFRDRVMILPDRLPEIPQRDAPALVVEKKRPYITLIASFAPDEPIAEFLEGAKAYAEKCTIFVTGRRSKAGSALRYESEQIVFTDFLVNEEFEALIQHSDLLVDLTLREDCLVCGAYEGISVEVPLLLSESEVNREFFPKGVIYAENSAVAYREALQKFLDSPDELREGIRALKHEFVPRWQKLFSAIESRLGELTL